MNTKFTPLPAGITPLAPGFHFDIPAARYHADNLCEMPSLSSSLAVELAMGAPKKAWKAHPRLNPQYRPRVTTKEMDFGSVVHELALGRGGGFVAWSGKTWGGKKAKAFKKDAIAAGKTPIKTIDLDRAHEAVAAVQVQLAEMGLSYVLEKGHSEAVAIWKEGDLYFRAMFDKWHPEELEIWDIKSTGVSAHPEKVSRHIASMNYDMRSQFYLRGAKNLTGMPAIPGGLSYNLLFIEDEAPFLISPGWPDDAFKVRGRRNSDIACRKWAECMESGKWPGYVTGAVEFQAPGWVDHEIEETGITPSGAIIA